MKLVFRGSVVVLLTLFSFALAPAASAQTLLDTLPPDIPLSRIVYQLYLDELTSLSDLNVNVSETDLDDPLALTQALGAQLSGFPVGSSAGGFTWTFDTNIGAFTRATSSFGPIFAERALTVGRKKLNFGINFQRATFDDFEGLQVRDGEIRFFNEVVPGQLYTRDSLYLNVSSNTVGFFLNYGLTDRLDLGLALPLVTVKMEASLRLNLVDGAGQQRPNFDFARTGSRSKSGFGDVIARAKYNVWKAPGGGLAAGLDVRLPTGDEDNLLGIAGTQAKVYGVFSTAVGRLNPHANVGYTFGKASSAAESTDTVLFPPSDEVNYAVGLDVSIHPKLTIAGDVVGRSLRDITRLEISDPFGLGAAFEEFGPSLKTSLHTVLGSAGVKYNIWGNLLVTGNVLFPLTDGGLRDKFTPLVGIDYSF